MRETPIAIEIRAHKAHQESMTKRGISCDENRRQEERGGGETLSSMRYRKADSGGREAGVTDLGCHGVGESLSPVRAVLVTVKPTTHGLGEAQNVLFHERRIHVPEPKITSSGFKSSITTYRFPTSLLHFMENIIFAYNIL